MESKTTTVIAFRFQEAKHLVHERDMVHRYGQLDVTDMAGACMCIEVTCLAAKI